MGGTLPHELQAVGPVVGMILALLALLVFPAYGAVADNTQLPLPTERSRWRPSSFQMV
jgi:hypothetical protein